MRQGLNVFGASPTAIPTSRIDGDPTATLVRAAGEAEVALGKNLSFSLAPRGQYAFDPLLSFEEFTEGNYTVWRGFDPGVILGDSGVGMSAEVRGPRLPFSLAGNADIRLQPYVFGDAAWVWNKDVSGSQRLTSAGGGVRAELGDRFRLDATLAVPLERAGFQTKRGDPRFLLTLTTRLLPWRNN